MCEKEASRGDDAYDVIARLDRRPSDFARVSVDLEVVWAEMLCPKDRACSSR